MSGPAYRCDRCERTAKWVAILPALSRPPQRARVVCGRHAPRSTRAYVFEIGRWFADAQDLHDPSRMYAMRDHLLDVKVHGHRAVALVEAALARALVLKEEA
jgi:hypothetical protein